jgi:ubiquinone/menaquinone biosynthesis C-methylase UbiE
MSWQRPEPGLWIRLLRFGFWMLYNPLAWTYDWVSKAVSLGGWREWQRIGLGELQGKRVLDLAFGTGDTLLDLHAARYCAIGLDLSPQMVHIAQRKLHSQGMFVPLVRGRCQQLPFAPSSFDSILSAFPAEFIAVPDTISEIARVLRPGGKAVVVLMAQFLPDSVWKWFLEWLYRITGQREPVPDLTPQLEALGLRYQTVWRSANGASVLLAVLEKWVDG